MAISQKLWNNAWAQVIIQQYKHAQKVGIVVNRPESGEVHSLSKVLARVRLIVFQTYEVSGQQRQR